MLIEFRVENHRSIRDEQVFTMEAVRTSEAEASYVREVQGHQKPLVTVAAFYGANASGKSNLLSALAFMRDAVVDSQRFWNPDGGVPRDPFAWGDRRVQPSLYELTFVRDGTRYQYGFVIDDERVLEEWLFAWPGSRKQVWFEREQAFKFGEHLKGENRLVEQLTRANALFLSAAAQLGHKQLQEIYSWIASMSLGGMLNRQSRRHKSVPNMWLPFAEFSSEFLSAAKPSQLQLMLFKDSVYGDNTNTQTADWIRRMLHIADIGIRDFKVEGRDGRMPRIQFLHKSEAAEAWLPIEEESSGTLSLLNVALSVLSSLSHGSVLVVDELERSLHPLLALYILNQFENRESNPKHAQLIFTTHDTNLLGTSLGEPPLARDQVWLTEKDQMGASVIYPLSDYKPRKAENVERGYLQGRYGAIPFLGVENLIDP
jgi:uncharacterized protein